MFDPCINWQSKQRAKAEQLKMPYYGACVFNRGRLGVCLCEKHYTRDPVTGLEAVWSEEEKQIYQRNFSKLWNANG